MILDGFQTSVWCRISQPPTVCKCSFFLKVFSDHTHLCSNKLLWVLLGGQSFWSHSHSWISSMSCWVAPNFLFHANKLMIPSDLCHLCSHSAAPLNTSGLDCWNLTVSAVQAWDGDRAEGWVKSRKAGGKMQMMGKASFRMDLYRSKGHIPARQVQWPDGSCDC